MKAKKLFATLAISTLAVAGVASYALVNGAAGFAAEDAATGNHYAAKAATCSAAGNAEYWINCATHEVSLTEPASGTWTDMGTYDGTLPSDHPAYIAADEDAHGTLDDWGFCSLCHKFADGNNIGFHNTTSFVKSDQKISTFENGYTVNSITTTNYFFSSYDISKFTKVTFAACYGGMPGNAVLFFSGSGGSASGYVWSGNYTIFQFTKGADDTWSIRTSQGSDDGPCAWVDCTTTLPSANLSSIVAYSTTWADVPSCTLTFSDVYAVYPTEHEHVYADRHSAIGTVLDQYCTVCGKADTSASGDDDTGAYNFNVDGLMGATQYNVPKATERTDYIAVQDASTLKYTLMNVADVQDEYRMSLPKINFANFSTVTIDVTFLSAHYQYVSLVEGAATNGRQMGTGSDFAFTLNFTVGTDSVDVTLKQGDETWKTATITDASIIDGTSTYCFYATAYYGRYVTVGNITVTK